MTDSELINDVKKFLGLPPYNNFQNICYNDGFFLQSLYNKYGEKVVKEYISKITKNSGIVKSPKKMTNEEALIYFKKRKEQIGLSDKVQQAENKAIEALEKQIPKKPNGRHCPTCGYGGLKYDKEQSIFVIIDYHHCNSCGQAIDWSGEVEE